MSAQKISLDKAKAEKLFYVVANVVIFRPSDGRCLVLKRSESEAVHPGKWCVPGGKLEWSDLNISKPTRRNGNVLDFEDAVEGLLAREAMEEAGVEISRDLKYINSVAYIRPDGVPTLLVKYAAEYRGGEVKTERGSFVDHAWVSAEEVGAMACIMGMPEEVAKAISIFSAEKCPA